MYRVEMVFGHADGNGWQIPSDQIRRAEHLALRAFALRFGGGQLFRHTGVYHHSDGRIVIEDSSTVWAYAVGVEPEMTSLTALAREIGTMLCQESVLLVILEMVGRMHWVRTDQDSESEPALDAGRIA